MRVVLVAALVMLLAWLIASAFQPPPPSPLVTQQKREECRDQCEQHVIVEHLSEEVLKACRARCEEPTRAHEPIRRITVAPADHSKTIRDVK